MAPRAPTMEVRAGGSTIGPGEARAISLILPGRTGQAIARDALPALVVVGRRPGPRVVVLAAPRGIETGAARVAAALGQRLRPDEIAGSVVVVPVLRPGGRFAGGGRPIRRDRQWVLPGDPAGGRAGRDAATVTAELAGKASLVIVLSEPNPARVGALTVRCDLDDPRTRKLAVRAGAPAIVHVRQRERDRAVGSPLSGAIRLDLSLPPASADPGEVAALLDRLLALEGVGPPRPAGAAAPPRRSRLFRRVTPVLGSSSGLLVSEVAPGDFVRKGAALGRVTAPVTGESKTIVAPHDGMVLETPARAGTRPGAKMFVVARAKRPARPSAKAPPDPDTRAETAGRPAATRGPGTAEGNPSSPLPSSPGAAVDGANDARPRTPIRVGWVERVSLPLLGIKRLMAKIDTGARTSALHVSRMKVVEPGGAHRRPTLEIAIPDRARKAGAAARVVRVHVRDYVQIKGTSGRSERRPVIETTLRLGPLQRRIRLTLTDRADMVYPMLVGRTALGVGVVVDPSGRRLWR